MLARALVYVELNDPIWSMFSATKGRLLDIGRPVGDFDILQASVAMTQDLTLVTNNEAHYRAMDVRLENWVTAGP